MPGYSHRDRIRTKHSWEYGLLSLTAVLNGAQLIGTNRGRNLGGRSLFVLTAANVVPAAIVLVARVDAPPTGACSTLDVTGELYNLPVAAVETTIATIEIKNDQPRES
jgi:hypothetical protein